MTDAIEQGSEQSSAASRVAETPAWNLQKAARFVADHAGVLNNPVVSADVFAAAYKMLGEAMVAGAEVTAALMRSTEEGEAMYAAMTKLDGAVLLKGINDV